jgi:hypothetical protein
LVEVVAEVVAEVEVEEVVVEVVEVESSTQAMVLSQNNPREL